MPLPQAPAPGAYLVMNLLTQFSTRGSTDPAAHRPRTVGQLLVLGAAALVTALVVGPALSAPPPPTHAEVLAAYVAQNSQSFAAIAHQGTQVTRDSFSATPGIETLAAGGTNHDWAKLVLLMAGWPMTDSNVTVILRWMRQENYVDSWWNRNNPLNNGWGSGGGGGTGSYDSLITAAENAAEALHQNPGYASIAEAFAASAPTAEIEAAIWASPWATGHYADGAHWHYNDVPVITAPASAW